MTASLRIATFNLESLDRQASDDRRYERRVAALRPLVERLRADVLCLQEIVELPLPLATSPDPVEPVEPSLILAVRSEIAAVPLGLQPEVTFQAVRDSR